MTRGPCAALLAASAVLFAHTASAQAQQSANPASAPRAAAQAAQPAAAKAVPHQYVAVSERAAKYYSHLFGVDQLRVKLVSSGSMMEFRYLVVDAEKAKALMNKQATPLLKDEKTGIKVGVPFMDNVGTLRQEPTPVVGKEYWMLFENPSKRIPSGSHVDITIGSFHVSGLVLE